MNFVVEVVEMSQEMWNRGRQKLYLISPHRHNQLPFCVLQVFFPVLFYVTGIVTESCMACCFFFKSHIVSCDFPQLPQITYYRPTRRGTKVVLLCYSGFLPWRWVVFKAGQQPEPHCSLTETPASVFGFLVQYLESDNVGRLYKPLRTEMG